MRLTEALVARLKHAVEDPGPQLIEGFRPAVDADYDAMVAALRAGVPEGGAFWLFAYGSLIWNPAFAFVEQRTAVLRGWHRAFCLGWDYRFRGSREAPGLMLALDRGGSCKGLAYRLAPDDLEASLQTLVRREMSMVPSSFPPRFVPVLTEAGPLQALTFAINRKSGRYISGLSDEEIAAVLAVAGGFRGTMAEYLFSTVHHLEQLGIHDRHLWHLQELVAERIEAAAAGDPA